MVEAGNPARAALAGLPPAVAARIATVEDWATVPDLAGVLAEGGAQRLAALARLSERDGAVIPVIAAGSDGPCDLARLVEERVVSTNTAAAGGNASLMTIG